MLNYRQSHGSTMGLSCDLQGMQRSNNRGQTHRCHYMDLTQAKNKGKQTENILLSSYGILLLVFLFDSKLTTIQHRYNLSSLYFELMCSTWKQNSVNNWISFRELLQAVFRLRKRVSSGMYLIAVPRSISRYCTIQKKTKNNRFLRWDWIAF